jgi:TusA-related sulfurtransferase
MPNTPLLDLRHVKCPLNFVKAKLALEKLPPHSDLTVWLANDATMDVPQSLRQEGYTVTVFDPPVDQPAMLCLKVRT